MNGWKRHAKLVRSLGFNPLDFADRSRNDRAKICAISALSYMLAEQWLSKYHGEPAKIYLVENNRNIEDIIRARDGIEAARK